MADRARKDDFIRTKVADDLRVGKHGGRVMTRFPPEPNGYLHIGHAKPICLNFGIAEEFPGGLCNLRFDDTNPSKEDVEYAEAIQRDIRWLGFDWGDRLYHASDYFEQLYEFAVGLIHAGKAYVDSSSEAEIREMRGTVTERGRPSPYRDRSVEENVDLFERMRRGEFPDGAHVLRAKIDMAAPNMLMRDPLLYRIRHAHHFRQGDAWCIYPMYDFAHCLSDAIEGVTHSLCSIEFKDNRELYDWVIRETGVAAPPEQTEFAKLIVDFTVVSKRKLLPLVEGGAVDGWDDPRLPTLAGMRRRGVTPEAIRAFVDLVGVARVESRVDYEKLEYCIRTDLNHRAPRVMCVVRPLRVVLSNYPEGEGETLDLPSFPRDVDKPGSRPVPFTRELYIERDDFAENPPPDFFRLAPGREVRLRGAYYITCDEIMRDASGEITELRCRYDPATKGGGAPDGRKVKGTLHWVSATRGVKAEVRLYDRLFTVPVPEEGDLTAHLNPDALVVVPGAWIEPSVVNDPPGTRYQFERVGYFISDEPDSTADALVFNRTVELRDTWAKATAKETRTPRPDRPRKADPARAKRARPSERAADSDPDVAVRIDRLHQVLGVPPEDARVVAAQAWMTALVEDAVAGGGDAAELAKWTTNEVAGAVHDAGVDAAPFGGAAFVSLVDMVTDSTISRSVAKDVLAEMVRTGADPRQIVERDGLQQVSDRDALAVIVHDVLQGNPDKVSAFRNGRDGLFGFFVGQAMKASGGRANPVLIKDLVAEQLGVEG